jgi:Helix-turn-helix domain
VARPIATPTEDGIPERGTEWLSEREVAAITKFEPRTLRNMRSQGRGPRYRKIGQAIRYRTQDGSPISTGLLLPRLDSNQQPFD